MRLHNEETGATALAIDTRELAELLHVSKRHLERMDASGRLPKPIRLGRAKRWLTSELEAWLEAGCPDRRTWLATKGGATW